MKIKSGQTDFEFVSSDSDEIEMLRSSIAAMDVGAMNSSAIQPRKSQVDRTTLAKPATSSKLSIKSPLAPCSFPPTAHAFVLNGRTDISFQPVSSSTTAFAGGVIADLVGGERTRTQIASYPPAVASPCQ